MTERGEAIKRKKQKLQEVIESSEGAFEVGRNHDSCSVEH